MSTNAISLKLNDLRKVLSNLDCLDGTILRQGEKDEGIIKVTNDRLALHDKELIINIQDNDFDDKRYRLVFADSNRELGKLLSFVINKNKRQTQELDNLDSLRLMTETFNCKKVSLSVSGILNFLNKLIMITNSNPQSKNYIVTELVPVAIKNLNAEEAVKLDAKGYIGDVDNPTTTDPVSIINPETLLTLKRIKHSLNSKEASGLINLINNPNTIDVLTLFKQLVELVCNHHNKANVRPLAPNGGWDPHNISEHLYQDRVFQEGTRIHRLCQQVANGNINFN